MQENVKRAQTAEARMLLRAFRPLPESHDLRAMPVCVYHYPWILDQYRTALEENWNGHQLTEAGLNLMIRDVAPETVGYAVEDLDDNGIPELAIGTISGDD